MTPEQRIRRLMVERARVVATLARIDGDLADLGVRARKRPPPRGTLTARVEQLLAAGPRTVAQIRAETGQTPHAAIELLRRLRLASRARRVAPGLYGAP